MIINDQGEEQEVYLQDEGAKGEPPPPAAATLLEEGLRARRHSTAPATTTTTSVPNNNTLPDTRSHKGTATIKNNIPNGVPPKVTLLALLKC